VPHLVAGFLEDVGEPAENPIKESAVTVADVVEQMGFEQLAASGFARFRGNPFHRLK